MRILLVEDSDTLAEMIMERFTAEGHAIDRESDGLLAEQLLRHQSFDLVILDINLPGQNGDDVLRDMRSRKDTTPVLVLTARSEIGDRITVLDIGADDYLTKPFDFGELAARSRALLRRRSGLANNLFQAGNFEYDRGSKRATVNASDIELRPREMQLLELFLANIDRLMSKEDVTDRIYTYSETPSFNAVEQIVTRLRKKLEGSPVKIRTVRGLGYIASIKDA
jgi:two-component system response regulator TctD